MSRIAFVGWYGHRNLGDEAFRLAFARIFPEHSLTFVPAFQVAPSDHDVYVVGAGDVLGPAYLRALPDEECKFLVIGAGLRHENDEAAMLSSCLDRLVAAWLRNRADVRALEGMGAASMYVPDITFLLAGDLPKRFDSTPRLAFAGSQSILGEAIARNDGGSCAYENYRRSEIAALLDRASSQYSIDFVPFCFSPAHYDLSLLTDIYSRMRIGRQAVRLLERPITFDEAVQRFAQCDVVLVQRYHALIASLIAGVPFVVCAESRKLSLFCQENDLAEALISPRGFTVEAALEAMERVRLPSWRERLLDVRSACLNAALSEVPYMRGQVLARG